MFYRETKKNSENERIFWKTLKNSDADSKAPALTVNRKFYHSLTKDTSNIRDHLLDYLELI